MSVCAVCEQDVPVGKVHVPGEFQPGAEPSCQTVTEDALVAYLDLHCTNCGAFLTEGFVHHPYSDRGCAVVAEGVDPPVLIFDVPVEEQPGMLPPIAPIPPVLGG